MLIKAVQMIERPNKGKMGSFGHLGDFRLISVNDEVKLQKIIKIVPEQ